MLAMFKVIPYLLACVIAASVPFNQQKAVTIHSEFTAWPKEFEGRDLIPISIDAKLRSMLSRNFGGKVGYFLNGTDEVVIRWVSNPGRSVHPATDCFQASGFRIRDEELCLDSQNELWRCFTAIKKNENYKVRERIIDSDGNSWSDVSSWYWAATLQKTSGPWWFYTIRSRR
jgi:hypothetical protein